MRRSPLLPVAGSLLLAGLLLGPGLGGCGADEPGSSGSGGKNSSGTAGGDDTIDPTPNGCVGLECDVTVCKNEGESTTLTGTVYAPSGTLPLYNAIVYVPREPDKPLDALAEGATCDTCTTPLQNVVRATLTDSKGRFVLDKLPAGKNIPLVVQVGKWRRQVVLPELLPCQENVLTDPQQTRLPRNKSEGDLPQMSIVTGGCDPLACLFRKLGLDDSEFTDSNGPGALHVYRGNDGAQVSGGEGLQAHTGLWHSVASLSRYDIVMLSCECGEHNLTKTTEQRGYMRDYLDGGGRVFATHFHYTWFKHGPFDFASIANWDNAPITSSPYTIDTSFPKGQAFVEWLQTVSASVTSDQIALDAVRHDVTTVNKGAQRWVYKPAEGNTPESVKYFTFNTPVGKSPDEQCGRAVFSDIHISEGVINSVPSGCDQNPLTDQEKALIFLFFDLASCVTPDEAPPPVPR